ncbi:DUF3603 family protein [Priestia flexa]|uniref:DUF3603 family protein n=1 Tax=Priestia flexa TaxID=86664 RepID=UPI0004741E89|nr:DUF3603 family protein [Priestia flexa]
MNYESDVWVKWESGKVNGNDVSEFHEWQKEDKVELIKQIPLIRVTTEFMDYVEYGLNRLPEDLLVSTENEAEVNNGKKIKNAFIISNGERILAVHTNNTKIPIYKSRLIPRQELQFLHTINEMAVTEYAFTPKKNVYGYLNLEPRALYGLFRKERNLKQVLYMALNDLKITDNKDVNKLRYLYGEWNYEGLNGVKDYTYEEIIDRLGEEMLMGWTDKHKRVTEFLVQDDVLLGEIFAAYDKPQVK